MKTMTLSLRKLRRAIRRLLWVVGTPDCDTPCMDCRDHLARVRIMRQTKRDGSSYAMKSHVLLRLCETCAMELVAQLVRMLQHTTRNRVDAELTHTTAERTQIAKSTGEAARHDRRVRARVRRLQRDKSDLPAARRP